MTSFPGSEPEGEGMGGGSGAAKGSQGALRGPSTGPVPRRSSVTSPEGLRSLGTVHYLNLV